MIAYTTAAARVPYCARMCARVPWWAAAHTVWDWVFGVYKTTYWMLRSIYLHLRSSTQSHEMTLYTSQIVPFAYLFA